MKQIIENDLSECYLRNRISPNCMDFLTQTNQRHCKHSNYINCSIKLQSVKMIVCVCVYLCVCVCVFVCVCTDTICFCLCVRVCL